MREPTVEIRVLGPVEVAGAPRRLSPKQRALLAVLVAARGGVVSVDSIAEELWPTRQPSNPVNVVQQYVGQLRTVLGDPDGTFLSTEPGGYRLAGVEVDAERFADLVVGSEGSEDEEPDSTVKRLDDALELWRGAAYADVTATTTLEIAAARLEDLRLTALEDRADAALALQRYAATAAELQQLVVEHPLRERFWGLLMTALWGTGRVAEALAAYRRLFEVLRDELGVEPSPAIRDLHQRILAGEDPPAAEVLTSRAESGIDVPRQLPVGTSAFVGRERDLAELDRLLDEADGEAVVISAIAGTAGIGKTALAVHWGHRVADRFPDGQLYLNLRGFDPDERQVGVAEAVDRLLDGLGVPAEGRPADSDARAAFFRSRVSERRMLLVLDNARDSAQVQPLLPASPGCFVVVTSRSRLTSLTAAGAAPLLLDLLDAAEARDLLSARLGADRIAAEPEAANRIISKCASLPLPLAVFAARAAGNPAFALADLAADLDDSGLDALASVEASTDLRTVFSWSVRQLTADAAELFTLLGVHPGPTISAYAAANLAGRSRSQTRRLLSELTDANLLTEYAAGRYALHDLLREYAAELAIAQQTGFVETALSRIARYYATQTWYARSRMGYLTPPSTTFDKSGIEPERFPVIADARAWLQREHGVLHNVVRTIDQRHSPDLDPPLMWLSIAFARYLVWQQAWHEAGDVIDVALRAAARIEDPYDQVLTNRYRADIDIQTPGTTPEDAWKQLQRTLELARAAGDLREQASVNTMLGWCAAELMSDWTRGYEYSLAAVELFDAVGDRSNAASSLSNAASLLARAGDPCAALPQAERAVAMVPDDAILVRGTALESLGWIHHQLGSYLEALTCLEASVDAIHQVGHIGHEASALLYLGDTHLALKNTDAARSAWTAAYEMLDATSHPSAAEARARLDSLP